MPDGGHPVASRASGLLTLANAVTLARLCAVPIAVTLVFRAAFGTAFGVFVAAGLSDALDGWLARRRGSSRIGALLDPLADKLLVGAMFFALSLVRAVPLWLAVIVIGRDVLIMGAGAVALRSARGRLRAIAPHPFSKLNTAVQIAFLCGVLGAEAAGIEASRPIFAGALAVGATTLASAAIYVWHGVRTR